MPLLGTLIVVLAWAPAGASTRRVELADGLVGALSDQQQLYLEAEPLAGEGLLSFTRRLCGDGDAALRAVADTNGGVDRLRAGVRYRVPFRHLLPEYKLRLVRGLFGADRGTAAGWEHRVLAANGTGASSLWRVAEWFTGAGENYLQIRRHNHLDDNDLEPGQRVVIPRHLLLPEFGAVLPSSPHALEYASDAAGEHALYRLEPGEALYSAVVVRFTGRVFAEDVNALAGEIARASGIRDVTDIPVGYPVKIPLDLLQPEFLPAGHPRRREYEENLVASGRFSNPVRAAHLQGITVILDAGHGGADVGAMPGGVWESLYVYDVMLRVKRILETRTAARVVTTTRDAGDGRPVDRDVLPASRGHRVLTEPEYPIEDSTVGVHLRWYLANSVFRRAVRENGGDRDKVVFLSIHADSLHPSLRGAMAYVPGAEWRGGSYGKSGSAYDRRREVREQPRVSFARRELVKSEGLSRELAGRLIASFRAAGLAVHPFKPVRERVVRQRRSWVPAVLRYNEVPAQVLLEVGNLANTEDRRLIQTWSWRQQVAEAVVDGLVEYYGPADAVPSVTAGG